MTVVSVEEKVEDYYKRQLDINGIKYHTKNDFINDSIRTALTNAESKSGGSGNNYPDIKLLLQTSTMRRIPVMIEAKGHKGKLIKTGSDGDILQITKKKDGSPDFQYIQKYAVNGALHYGYAILDNSDYGEVICIGVNGYIGDDLELHKEIEAYYISNKNPIPLRINDVTDLSFLKDSNLDKLTSELDNIALDEKTREIITKQAESTLESRIKSIHQQLYDDEQLKIALTTNEKLYLFTGLIMAGLKTDGVKTLTNSDFESNNDEIDNDGQLISRRIESFLKKKGCSQDKIEMISALLKPVFKKRALWIPVNGESKLKTLYNKVSSEVIPCLQSDLHLDFMGKIFNSLNDWVAIDNDKKNDVVLTPRYITTFMAKLAQTNKDSFVWDAAMGSAGFLVAAMDIMIKDAEKTIHDLDELERKKHHIKEKQLLGVEILGNIYLLAVLNMILMGDGSSNIFNEDSLKKNKNTFPATVFLLNPPYSADGKGFIFVDKALRTMTNGYACILIQENAGSGNGLPYTKNILKNNTLIASIHMADIFKGKSNVQTAIYLFKVSRPHEINDLVTFIDFSEDGYTRQNRKKSSQNINLKNTDHAIERYNEVEAIILNKKKETNYYNIENGKVINDTITLNGDDWVFSQHVKLNTIPSEDDLKKTIKDYLDWKVSQNLRE